jgi:hypothetical protein
MIIYIFTLTYWLQIILSWGTKVYIQLNINSKLILNKKGY